MLWIALHLPLLSLETVACLTADQQAALAIVDAHHIVHANRAAQALGIRPGLKRATALALAPQLLLAQADAARDALALQAVAHVALAFTPSVCFDPQPQTVLLEVQASLRYFGGFERLRQRLREALQPLGHQILLASAPTAQAAALLCRMAHTNAEQGRAEDLICVDLKAATQHLDAAPVGLLTHACGHHDTFQAIGLRTIGDLRRLPRAGLARRFGEALLHEIDHALGRRPDPRQPITLPEQFSSQLELLARADTTEQVLYGARVLLNRLVVWAVAQQARVGRFTLQMLHEKRHRNSEAVDTPAVSELKIALTEASCDVDHLQLLLRERLAQVRLAAPTLELRLLCTELVQRPPPNGELFPTARNEKEGLIRLIERLQARLGGEQVQRLKRVEDHRPERASQLLPFDGQMHLSTAPRTAVRSADAADAAASAQPVWLLAQPQPLAERQRRPLLDGRALQLLCGPERIETGWWDENGLAERDYFIAQAADGSLVWIYRGRLPLRADGDDLAADVTVQPGWFLHGRFA